MKPKASQDYALSMVCYLARKGGIASSLEVSEAESVPRDYLIQIAQDLRNAGIIDAMPGKRGGYLLAKPADEISVFDVLVAADLNPSDRVSGIEAARIERFINYMLCGLSIAHLTVGGARYEAMVVSPGAAGAAVKAVIDKVECDAS